MFFTRYSRGRPKGVDENKIPIYVCESRYNETEKHFNRIKTWKSCVPDAVRGEDYEVDLFEKQRVLKKVPSPIAHLLPPNAKEGDTLPDAKMGVENAPPVVGAVFKRARREAVCCPFSFAVVCFFSSFAMANRKPLPGFTTTRTNSASTTPDAHSSAAANSFLPLLEPPHFGLPRNNEHDRNVQASTPSGVGRRPTTSDFAPNSSNPQHVRHASPAAAPQPNSALHPRNRRTVSNSHAPTPSQLRW